jgi:GNAT superfamily N-acetyltransferase
MNNVAGVLDLVPDEPRWVEARGMLLSGRGIVRWAAEHGALLYAPEDAVVSVVGAVPAAELRALLAGVPPGTVALIAPEDRDMLAQFAGWTDQRAIHVVGARRAWDWPPDVNLFGPDDAPPLEHLPDRLRRDLLRVLAFGSVAAACCDELPVSFAYPGWETETLYDVSIDTLEAYRGRGLGGRSVTALMIAMAERMMMPVWGALEVNAVH